MNALKTETLPKKMTKPFIFRFKLVGRLVNFLFRFFPPYISCVWNQFCVRPIKNMRKKEDKKAFCVFENQSVWKLFNMCTVNGHCHKKLLIYNSGVFE